MIEAIAYYRKSQDKRGQDNSLEAQEKAVSKFAKANGFTITDTFQDIASGLKDDRQGLLLASRLSLKTGKPILVRRIDRLGRKASTIMTMLMLFKWASCRCSQQKNVS